MFDEQKNYWLYISSDVYCCIKGEKALLYNTANGRHLETDSTVNIRLLEALHETTSLGSIGFEGARLQDDTLREFLTRFCEAGMGGLVDRQEQPQKPVQMMPMLNLQQDIERLPTYSTMILARNSLNYLLELNIYLSNTCMQNCSLCGHYFLQSLCCTRLPEVDTELELEDLSHLLHQVKHSAVGRINLLGGDIFNYRYFQDLLPVLSGFEDRVHIWNHYTRILAEKTPLPPLFYEVIVPFPYQETELRACAAALEKVPHKFHFYITGEEEYSQSESVIEALRLTDYAIHPIFTGTNLDFFEAYIYSSREEILEPGLAFRQIFANQKMNSNFFGVLTVLPTADVYANLNGPCLGNLKEQNILDLIQKEMTENTAWRKTRNGAPCCDCLYQYLCPPVSNYESVIKKMNLCHVMR